MSTRRLFRDDVLAIAATVFSFGLSGTIVVQWQNGMGEHIQDVSLPRLEKMMQAFFASVILYNLGLVAIKCSICFQFLNFFRERGYRRMAWAMIVICVSFGICAVLVCIFACKPIAYWWDKGIPGGKCVSFVGLWFANSGICIATDLALCIMPMPLLKTLQLPRKQKYSLMAVFAVGGFAFIVGLLRLHAIYVLTYSTDVTFQNDAAAYWSSVELNVGIICACLPTIRPIVTKLFPNLLASSQHRMSTVATISTIPKSSIYPGDQTSRGTPLTRYTTADSMTFCTMPESIKEASIDTEDLEKA